MDAVKKLLGVFLLGGAALFVGINLLRQRGATFRPIGYRLAVPQGRPALDITIEIFNPSELNIQLGDINLTVSLKGSPVGIIQPLKMYNLPAKKRSRIILPLNLTGGGAPLIAALLTAQTQNQPIQISGSYTAGGIKQAVNTTINAGNL